MRAYEIYRELNKVGGWKEKSRAVRWCAARYYANVDNVNQLRHMAENVLVSESRGGTMRASITSEDVREIIMLR